MSDSQGEPRERTAWRRCYHCRKPVSVTFAKDFDHRVGMGSCRVVCDECRPRAAPPDPDYANPQVGEE